MTTPGNFFLIELLGPEMLIRACVHIVQSLMESLRGYIGGIIDFITGIAFSYEDQKRMLRYYLQLHIRERKVSIIWEHSFNTMTKLQVEKNVILSCCIYYLNIKVHYSHILCDLMTLYEAIEITVSTCAVVSYLNYFRCFDSVQLYLVLVIN